MYGTFKNKHDYDEEKFITGIRYAWEPKSPAGLSEQTLIHLSHMIPGFVPLVSPRPNILQLITTFDGGGAKTLPGRLVKGVGQDRFEHLVDAYVDRHGSVMCDRD